MEYTTVEVGSKAWEFYTQDGKNPFPKTMIFKNRTVAGSFRREVPVEKTSDGNYRWERSPVLHKVS